MSILTPPLSKRGILKALGQDPSKSDVLTVSTNSDGGVSVEAVVNNSSVSLSASVSGNYFPTVGGASNIPAQSLPVGGAAWMGAGYRPRSGSPLLGIASPVGVMHDYYGAPFLATPAVGAVQG